MSTREVKINLSLDFTARVEAKTPQRALAEIMKLSLGELLDLIAEDADPSLWASAETSINDSYDTSTDWIISPVEVLEQLDRLMGKKHD